jgi:putative phosphoribosyl transferase
MEKSGKRRGETMAAIFKDRVDAGRRLAEELARYADREDAIVLGLPRGGVVVAGAVAEALRVPLDVLLVRKLGVPGNEELAMGAIATGGMRVINRDVILWLGIPDRVVEDVAAREMRELERRERAFRGDRPRIELHGKVAILVDDGIATGATMRAAVSALRAAGPGRIVVAVPVAPPDACARLEKETDELVCLARVEPFGAVGSWYLDFPQATDDEVRGWLERRPGGSRPSAG